jgi:hypothetical protein
MGLNADLQFPQRPHEFFEIAEVVPAGGPGDFRPGNPGSAATIGPKHPAPRNPPVADFQRPDTSLSCSPTRPAPKTATLLPYLLLRIHRHAGSPRSSSGVTGVTQLIALRQSALLLI